MRAWVIAVALAGVPLASCSGLYGDGEGQGYLQRVDQITPGAGDAKERNRVTQTDTPWPPHVANPRVAVDGQRMTNAVKNYRSGPTANEAQMSNTTPATTATPNQSSQQ